MTMAERIKQRRAEIGMSQRVLADLVGVSQPAIAKIEKGAETAHVMSLAKALRVTPEWLTYGSEPKEPFSFQALKKAQEESGEDVFLPSEIDYVDQHKHEGSSYVVSVKYDKAPESVKSTIDDLLSLPADQAEEIAATIQKLKGIYGSGGKT